MAAWWSIRPELVVDISVFHWIRRSTFCYSCTCFCGRHLCLFYYFVFLRMGLLLLVLTLLLLLLLPLLLLLFPLPMLVLLLSMLLQPLLQVLSPVSLFITIAVAIVIIYRCCQSSLPLFLFLLLFYHSATQVSNFFHTRVCQAAQSSLLSHLALKSQASNPGECSGCLTRLANSSGVGTNWAILWGDRMRSTGYKQKQAAYMALSCYSKG